MKIPDQTSEGRAYFSDSESWQPKALLKFVADISQVISNVLEMAGFPEPAFNRLTKIVNVLAAKKNFSLMIAGILKTVSSSIPVVQYL